MASLVSSDLQTAYQLFSRVRSQGKFSCAILIFIGVALFAAGIALVARHATTRNDCNPCGNPCCNGGGSDTSSNNCCYKKKEECCLPQECVAAGGILIATGIVVIVLGAVGIGIY